MRSLIATALIVAPVPAVAQSGGCRITVSGIDFGIYSALSPAPHNNIGNIEVRCVPGGAPGGLPRVTMSPGNSGNYLDRTLTSGQYELHYNLYTDVTRIRVLGDGSSGTVPFPPPRTRAFGLGRFPIYGAIPPGQRVPAGVYSDTLLIQVEF